MTCPLYGLFASTRSRLLLPTGGNQCPLILGQFAPCVRPSGPPPSLRNCTRAREPENLALLAEIRDHWDIDLDSLGIVSYATYEHLRGGR